MERTAIGMVLAKIEGTYGVDSVPTGAANVIAVLDNTVKFGPKFTHITRQIADGSFSRVQGANTLPEVSFGFTVELRGNRTDGVANDISNGTSAQAIEIDALLKSCDLSPAYQPATVPGTSRDGSVIYSIGSTTGIGSSMTFYFYTGLKLHKVVGCKGTVKITFQAGQYGKLDFTFSGLYVDVVDAALPAAGNCLATVGINAAGTGYVVGDVLTIAGGGLVSGALAATARVTAVSSAGAITGIKVGQVGLYSSSPTLTANAATGGTGTAATLTGTMTAQTAAVFLNTKPPLFANSGSTVGSYSPVFTKLDFDLGNKVSKREDGNSVNGVAGFVITDRMPKVTIDPESVIEETSPVWDDLFSNTSRVITGKIGTQTGNQFQFLTVGTPENVSYGDRNGIRTNPISYAIERPNLTDVPGLELLLKFF